MSRMTRILALDVGGTTGTACRLDDLELDPRPYRTGTVSNAQQLLAVVIGTPWELVIIENFQANNLLDMHGHYTVELIGAVKALCTVRGIPWLVQAPAYRMSSLMESKAWHVANWTHPKALMRHSVDALAHLFAYEEKGPPKPSHSVRETKWRET